MSFITQKYFWRYGLTVMAIISSYDIRQFASEKTRMRKIKVLNKSIVILLFLYCNNCKHDDFDNKNLCNRNSVAGHLKSKE
jgi:hypothetical protein